MSITRAHERREANEQDRDTVADTRDRILDAAWHEIASRGRFGSMRRLAEAVGVSRQALYLHFPGRAALLLALVDHVDAHTDLAAGVDSITRAPDAVGALRAAAALQVAHNPKIAAVARVLDAERHRDPDAATAWQDRVDDRRTSVRAIVDRLAAEGHLHPGWSTDEATTLLQEMLSFRVWDDLVHGSGIAPARYCELVVHTARCSLGAPPP